MAFLLCCEEHIVKSYANGLLPGVMCKTGTKDQRQEPPEATQRTDPAQGQSAGKQVPKTLKQITGTIFYNTRTLQNNYNTRYGSGVTSTITSKHELPDMRKKIAFGILICSGRGVARVTICFETRAHKATPQRPPRTYTYRQAGSSTV